MAQAGYKLTRRSAYTTGSKALAVVDLVNAYKVNSVVDTMEALEHRSWQDIMLTRGYQEVYDPGPSASLTTPTFSCYMRANPFSKEKAEYLQAHQRRMKEFGPRPYVKGDYPEIPRHYPGVRAVYQWEQIDAVTDRLYYIPQRWTYHRDHLTLPTAKARRDFPPQDAEYAANATLRGVVSYTEAQRRAASPSPGRPPQGPRRPGAPGSAVSRAVSQGSTLTTQTRGRRQRPRSCLPRAPTPQPGEEESIVQLMPLLPRKPPSGVQPRSQTPTPSQHSDQSSTTAGSDRHYLQRPPTGHSGHSQRHSAGTSRPATAGISTISRKSRSLGRPSTAVSRRTRWSDVADDAESLNSSILELLQTIHATDGKLTPLSPRADRGRAKVNKPPSPETEYSGYPMTTATSITNATANVETLSTSDESEYQFIVTSNFRKQSANGEDSSSNFGVKSFEAAIPRHNIIKSPKVLQSSPTMNDSKLQTAFKVEGSTDSNNYPEQCAQKGSEMTFQKKGDYMVMEKIESAPKMASIDFGVCENTNKLSSRQSSGRVKEEDDLETLEQPAVCTNDFNAGASNSKSPEPLAQVDYRNAAFNSNGFHPTVQERIERQQIRVNVEKTAALGDQHQKGDKAPTSALNEEEGHSNDKWLLESAESYCLFQKNKDSEGRDRSREPIPGVFHNGNPPVLTEKPEIALDLSQTSSETNRASSPTSEGESVSQAEYLLVSGAINVKADGQGQSRPGDKREREEQGQECQEQPRGEDTD